MWDDSASRGLGMTIAHIAAGLARLSIPVRSEMVNGHCLCQGVFIFPLFTQTILNFTRDHRKVIAVECAIDNNRFVPFQSQ